MALIESQKSVKSKETGDSGNEFVKKQNHLYRECVISRQEKARTGIRKNRSNKQKDLHKRIRSLKRSVAVKQPGTDADALSRTAYGTLRGLLARKSDIERHITESIEGLGRAMHTTSRELQIVLASRAELLTTAAKTTASADPTTTAPIVKP